MGSAFLWYCLYVFEYDKLLQCDHLNKNYWEVQVFLWFCLLHVCFTTTGGFNFWIYWQNPKVWPFKWKLLSSTFLWCYLLCCTRWFQLLGIYIKSCCVTIQMIAIEQYFPVVLFIMLYKVALPFKYVHKIL